MKYKGYEIKRVDDRNRGWGVFDVGTNRFAWVCKYWGRESDLRVVANHKPCGTVRDARTWIDNGLCIDEGSSLVFASSREEAEAEVERSIRHTI